MNKVISNYLQNVPIIPKSITLEQKDNFTEHTEFVM